MALKRNILQLKGHKSSNIISKKKADILMRDLSEEKGKRKKSYGNK